MGTCYELIRRDTRTVYTLGKSYFLHHAFGRCDAEIPMCVSASDVDTIVALILAAQRGDLDGRYDVSVHRQPDDVESDAYNYWRAVALDVIDWAEGQPFEFHSEHSGLSEEIAMDAFDLDPMHSRLFKTGSRYDDDREQLAQRRKIDEAFRRGNVWLDHRTREEIVQAVSSAGISRGA